MAYRIRLGLVTLSFVGLAGCGPSRALDDDAGTGESADDGEDADDPCDAFLDDAEGPRYTLIEVFNGGTEPVYLTGIEPCEFARLQITEADAEDVSGPHWPARRCEPTCEAVFEGDELGCDLSCPYATPVKVAPGGRYVVSWDGRLQTPGQPPDACCDGEVCFGPCFTALAVREGDLEATVHVATDLSCMSASCDCTPNADGWCEVDGLFDGDPTQAIPASVGFTAPAETVRIELQ